MFLGKSMVVPTDHIPNLIQSLKFPWCQNCEILRSNHFPERNSQVLMVYRHQNWRFWDVGLMVLPWVPSWMSWGSISLFLAKAAISCCEKAQQWQRALVLMEAKRVTHRKSVVRSKTDGRIPWVAWVAKGKDLDRVVFFFQLCPHVLCYTTGVLLRMLAPERKTRHICGFQWARGAGI